MTLTLFCIPVHLNKHNITLIKLGTNDVNMMTSWRCFPRYNVFDCFSLKETEKICWIVGVRLKFISLVIIENHIFTSGYATHENIAFYDHSWNKFLSYTNIQQISSI